ncbi:hypothetical protein ACFLIM_44675 [Nonomuraea sp. M3C6]|uniref:Uncharacterized protein n=1 Tax=Nonomuraea marmarensis TaxID=3351344 RepID=A0ABW7AVN7_9ACTN
MHESGSGRLCGRCGSHVGNLSQCPRCRAPIAPPPTAAPPPPTGPPPPIGGGREPASLGRTPAWRRPSVLLSLAAACFALALTWWIVADRPAPANEAAETQQGRAPVLATSSPEPGSPEPGNGSPPATDASSPDPATGTASPDPAATPSDPAAAQQAQDMNGLLSSSSSTRSSLSLAIASTSRCERDGVDTIQDITASRGDQLAAAGALTVTALPEGAELKGALVDALSASHDADAAFLAWARRYVGGDCTGAIAKDRDYKRGLDRSEAAQAAKRRFAEAWRPIAETYDLTAWKPSQI